MRISDWSSDVCSSDLLGRHLGRIVLEVVRAVQHAQSSAVGLPGAVQVDEGGHKLGLGIGMDGAVLGARLAAQGHHGGLPGEVDPELARKGVRHRRTLQLIEQGREGRRSEEHTSELQSLMRISYAVFCLKKKNKTQMQTLLPSLRKYNKQHTHLITAIR